MFNRVIGTMLGLSKSANITDLLDRLKVSDISSQEFIDAVNDRYASQTSNKIDDTVWSKGEIGSIFESFKPMYELAQACRDAGLVTGILSNVYPATADLIRSKGLYDEFDPVILSCDARMSKPDPAFYQLAEESLDGIQPHEILFIDDQMKCITAADTRDWWTVHLVDPNDAIKDVKRIVGIQ